MKLWSIILFSRPWIRVLIVALSFFSTIAGISSPFLQRQFVDAINSEQAPLLLFYACLALAASFLFQSLTNLIGVLESQRMQSWVSNQIFKKTLELRTDGLQSRGVGEVVAYYTTDVPGATIVLDQSFPSGLSIFFPLLLTPFVLQIYFEIPWWITSNTLFVLIILNLLLAFRQSRFFYRFKNLAATRIGLVNEWIQNIRTLRILGWIEGFEKKIFQSRIIETQNRVSMVTNGQAMNSISTSITFILNMGALFLLIHYSNKELTKGDLLSLFWLVGIFLTKPCRNLPWFFVFLFDAKSSIDRLQSFFDLKNAESSWSNNLSDDQPMKKIDINVKAPVIQVNQLNLKYKNQNILNDISFEIFPEEFIGIVGEVGAGKTQLLLSLIGETPAYFSDYKIFGQSALQVPLNQIRQFFSWVPQEGFIMSANVRDNVAFSYNSSAKLDESIFEILKTCQFSPNQERLNNGLETSIGERGVNLSGGQKQRLNLSRVAFANAPIILLDDALSAVDVETENKLLDELILKLWANKTRILITHRLTVLDKCDRIIFMENGRINEIGSFSKMIQSNIKFKDFCTSLDLKTSENNSTKTNSELNLNMTSSDSVTPSTLQGTEDV